MRRSPGMSCSICDRPPRARSWRFEQVPFDHPLWVLYSSGTTGLPKAIVQGHGGILLEQLKKRLHLDLRPGDRMFWFTTTGWMMWNFLVGCLLSDAAIVLYDGSPAHPDLGFLWRPGGARRDHVHGREPGAACELREGGRRAGARPRPEQRCARSARPARRCRRRASTGCTSTSSATCGCSRRAAARTCARRSWRAARCCRCTRANCSAARSAARWRRGTSRAASVSDEVGELVITEPMPSMPLFLWGDDGRRAPARELLRDVPGRVAPRRLDPHHAARRRGDLRALGLDDQPPGRAHGHRARSTARRTRVPEVLDALVVDIPSRRGRGARARAVDGACSSCCARA